MSKNVEAGKRGFIYDPATTSLDLMADGVIVSKFSSDAEISGIYEESATQLYEVGTRRALSDGRVFRYCHAGSALWVGMGAHDGSTPGLFTLTGTHSLGAAYMTIPDTDATHTANYWKDGYVSVEGYGPWMRRIVSSTASNGTTCNLYLDTVLPAALTTNNVQVVRNPYINCYKITTAAQAKLSGFVCVPPIAVTSGYYFWGQTWGPCSGCPADFFGDLEFERAVCFMDTDGAIQSGQRGEAGSKYYQIAGYLMGNYTAATDHRIPIYMLTLAP